MTVRRRAGPTQHGQARLNLANQVMLGDEQAYWLPCSSPNATLVRPDRAIGSHGNRPGPRDRSDNFSDRLDVFNANQFLIKAAEIIGQSIRVKAHLIQNGCMESFDVQR